VFCDVEETDIKRLSGKIRGRLERTSTFDMLALAIDGHALPAGALKTKIIEQRGGPFKGKEVCMCTFLSGTVGEKVRCSVYSDRPETCRVVVKAGDRHCQKVRRFWIDIAKKNQRTLDNRGSL
jgi:Fe-S-cluster containining protein